MGMTVMAISDDNSADEIRELRKEVSSLRATIASRDVQIRSLEATSAAAQNEAVKAKEIADRKAASAWRDNVETLVEDMNAMRLAASGKDRNSLEKDMGLKPPESIQDVSSVACSSVRSNVSPTPGYSGSLRSISQTSGSNRPNLSPAMSAAQATQQSSAAKAHWQSLGQAQAAVSRLHGSQHSGFRTP